MSKRKSNEMDNTENVEPRQKIRVRDDMYRTELHEATHHRLTSTPSKRNGVENAEMVSPVLTPSRRGGSAIKKRQVTPIKPNHSIHDFFSPAKQSICRGGSSRSALEGSEADIVAEAEVLNTQLSQSSGSVLDEFEFDFRPPSQDSTPIKTVRDSVIMRRGSLTPTPTVRECATKSSFSPITVCESVPERVASKLEGLPASPWKIAGASPRPTGSTTPNKTPSKAPSKSKTQKWKKFVPQSNKVTNYFLSQSSKKLQYNGDEEVVEDVEAADGFSELERSFIDDDNDLFLSDDDEVMIVFERGPDGEREAARVPGTVAGSADRQLDTTIDLTGSSVAGATSAVRHLDTTIDLIETPVAGSWRGRPNANTTDSGPSNELASNAGSVLCRPIDDLDRHVSGTRGGRIDLDGQVRGANDSPANVSADQQQLIDDIVWIYRRSQGETSVEGLKQTSIQPQPADVAEVRAESGSPVCLVEMADVSEEDERRVLDPFLSRMLALELGHVEASLGRQGGVELCTSEGMQFQRSESATESPKKRCPEDPLSRLIAALDDIEKIYQNSQLSTKSPEKRFVEEPLSPGLNESLNAAVDDIEKRYQTSQPSTKSPEKRFVEEPHSPGLNESLNAAVDDIEKRYQSSQPATMSPEKRFVEEPVSPGLSESLNAAVDDIEKIYQTSQPSTESPEKRFLEEPLSPGLSESLNAAVDDIEKIYQSSQPSTMSPEKRFLEEPLSPGLNDSLVAATEQAEREHGSPRKLGPVPESREQRLFLRGSAPHVLSPGRGSAEQSVKPRLIAKESRFGDGERRPSRVRGEPVPTSGGGERPVVATEVGAKANCLLFGLVEPRGGPSPPAGVRHAAGTHAWRETYVPTLPAPPAAAAAAGRLPQLFLLPADGRTTPTGLLFTPLQTGGYYSRVVSVTLPWVAARDRELDCRTAAVFEALTAFVFANNPFTRPAAATMALATAVASYIVSSSSATSKNALNGPTAANNTLPGSAAANNAVTGPAASNTVLTGSAAASNALTGDLAVNEVLTGDCDRVNVTRRETRAFDDGPTSVGDIVIKSEDPLNEAGTSNAGTSNAMVWWPLEYEFPPSNTQDRQNGSQDRQTNSQDRQSDSQDRLQHLSAATAKRNLFTEGAVVEVAPACNARGAAEEVAPTSTARGAVAAPAEPGSADDVTPRKDADRPLGSPPTPGTPLGGSGPSPRRRGRHPAVSSVQMLGYVSQLVNDDISHPARRLQILETPDCAGKGTDCPHQTCRELDRYRAGLLEVSLRLRQAHQGLAPCATYAQAGLFLPPHLAVEVINCVLDSHEPATASLACLVLAQQLAHCPPCSQAVRRCYASVLAAPVPRTDRGLFHEVLYRLEQLFLPTAEEGVEGERGGEGGEGEEETLDRRISSLNVRDEEPESYAALPRDTRLRRACAVLSHLLSVLEQDLLLWLHDGGGGGCGASQAGRRATLTDVARRPLVVALFWPRCSRRTIGTMNAACRRVVGLMYAATGRAQRLVQRLLALMAEVVTASEEVNEKLYPNLGVKCTEFAREITNQMPAGTVVSRLTARLRPSWLALLVTHQVTCRLILLHHPSPSLEVVVACVNLLVQSANPTPPPAAARAAPTTPRTPRTSANKTDKNGETRLHVACRTNRLTEVRALLDNPDVDVNIGDNLGWRPLHEAVAHGRVDCVEMLLAYNPPLGGGRCVDVRAANRYGQTPLMDAAITNHVQIAGMLLRHAGWCLLGDERTDGSTAYHLARGADMLRCMEASRRDDYCKLGTVPPLAPAAFSAATLAAVAALLPAYVRHHADTYNTVTVKRMGLRSEPFTNEGHRHSVPGHVVMNVHYAVRSLLKLRLVTGRAYQQPDLRDAIRALYLMVCL